MPTFPYRFRWIQKQRFAQQKPSEDAKKAMTAKALKRLLTSQALKSLPRLYYLWYHLIIDIDI